MPSAKPYILFCAGEDSGDCIGEALVCATRQQTGAFDCVGAGGPRMQGAGFQSLVDYESLPVSGFGDVVPRYVKLRKSLSSLETALKNPLCRGLVAIDYPGFNMKLMNMAGTLRKPCLYVAPPQVWAWKKKRAVVLSKIEGAKLAVLFPFEKKPYEEVGCSVSVLQHPFVQSSCQKFQTEKDGVLLLPGSREKQMLRNVPVFLNVVNLLPEERFVFVVARESLIPKVKREIECFFKGKVPAALSVVCAPAQSCERSALYRKFKAALTAPGTATLELALSGVPFVVSTRPDVLTYHLGKLFVKTKSYALPNIILEKSAYPEYIRHCWSATLYQQVAETLEKIKKESAAARYSQLENDLRQKLSSGCSPVNLVSEFLAQLL